MRTWSLDELESGVKGKRRAHQRLTFWINVWAVEGMTGNNVDIFWQMLLESSDLRSFAGGLTSNDSTLLRSCRALLALKGQSSFSHLTWTELSDDFINGSSFDIVNDVVA